MAEPLLSLAGISKIYPGVTGTRRCQPRTSSRGEVLGLIGENGAGKSTLMKIIGGVVAPDAGTISIDGKTHAAMTVSVHGARRHRLRASGTQLFENLDVAANVFIGRERSPAAR